MLVLGSANHSPDFILVYLKKKLKAEENRIALIASETRIVNKRKPFDFYIFLNPKALRRNLKIVNKLDSVGIVCGPPIELNNFENLMPLDHEESDSPHLEAFLLDTIDRNSFKPKQSQPIVYRSIDYAMVVQDKVESFTGILTSFMTFVYTMPSSSHQKPVKELACKWLVSGASLEQLEKKLQELTKDVYLTDKQKARFLSLLSSESALAYKDALQEAKQYSIDSIDFRNIADKHSVSAYEMRYMLSVVKALK